MKSRIHIIGIGDDGIDGLTRHAREVIASAEVLIGNRNSLSGVPESFLPVVTKVLISGGLDELFEAVVRNLDRKTALLTSGDPLFYGIARYLTDRLGKNRFEVIPHVSIMQLAFARVKESWDDAFLSNLATQPIDRVIDGIRTAERVGLFTTDTLTPELVAKHLLDRRIDYFSVYVCENLGTPDETVTYGDLETVAEQQFKSLNVMILVRRACRVDRLSEKTFNRLFGNPDEAFLQSRPKRGLMTPSEVRSIALSELVLEPISVVWDVGAGSGSLAIEAARIAHKGKVYGIEMDAEDFALMIENAASFECPSLVPIHGRAPEAWSELPDPDAIFVGGTGRAAAELVRQSVGRLNAAGRIVVNVSDPVSLVEVQRVLESEKLNVDIRMINIARSQYQLDRIVFESLNPTFLVIGCRGARRLT